MYYISVYSLSTDIQNNYICKNFRYIMIILENVPDTLQTRPPNTLQKFRLIWEKKFDRACSCNYFKQMEFLENYTVD